MPGQRLHSINGAMIKWAREDAGYSLSEVARSCGFSGDDLVEEIEENRLKPTLLQAEKMAIKFNRPIAFFYLTTVPQMPSREGTDNRSPILATPISPKSILALRKLADLQELVHELHQDFEITDPDVPSFSTSQSPSSLGEAIRGYLGIDDLPRMLRRDTALKSLVEKVENKGIIVSQQSMPRAELQGASSYEPYPAILINHSDYPSSKIFTLIHELCHLGLRSGGLCLIEPEPTHTVETFCNAVAGETLVPASELVEKLGSHNPALPETISQLADYFCVSREVVLLRLINQNLVEDGLWDALVPVWRRETADVQTYYHRAGPATRAIRENGQNVTSLVLRSFNEGRLSSAEASRYLGIRSGVLEDVRRRV